MPHIAAVLPDNSKPANRLLTPDLLQVKLAPKPKTPIPNVGDSCLPKVNKIY